MKVTLIGIDLAKTIFQVCGVNQAGRPVFNKRVKRDHFMTLVLQYPNAVIAMEACSGSNYLGRTLVKQGYEVKLLPPQHVKPFVKGNKNDRNDAFAITEAARRPGLKPVQPRTLEQTDMMLHHRIRERHVSARTALINQLRGLLSEYGLIMPQGKRALRQELELQLEEAENDLTVQARASLSQLLEEWRQLDNLIATDDQLIKTLARAHESVKRLTGIRGIAEHTASALYAYAGHGHQYENGRHFSASLGLVPKEHSSGGKQQLGRITKRGNRYIRTLLIQGAWSVIRYSHKSHDRLSVWAVQLIARRGKQKAAVAIANKLARISWALLFHQTDYQAT